MEKVKYFGYGSNLSSEELRAWCPSARALDTAKARDYKLAFTRFSPKWGGGVADIIPEKDSYVWGVLYEIDEDDIEKLDRKESVDRGGYQRHTIKVETRSGQIEEALTYVVVGKAEFERPTIGYLNTLLKGAEEFGLPKDYTEALRQTETR